MREQVHFKALLPFIIAVKSALVYPFGPEEKPHNVALINSIPRWRDGIKSMERAERTAETDRW